jgi:hypothetical protein
MQEDETVAAAPDPLVEHHRFGLALLQPAKLFKPTGELPQRRRKGLLERLLRAVIRGGRGDEPPGQARPANDNAPTTRPPGDAHGLRPLPRGRIIKKGRYF